MFLWAERFWAQILPHVTRWYPDWSLVHRGLFQTAIQNVLFCHSQIDFFSQVKSSQIYLYSTFHTASVKSTCLGSLDSKIWTSPNASQSRCSNCSKRMSYMSLSTQKTNDNINSRVTEEHHHGRVAMSPTLLPLQPVLIGWWWCLDTQIQCDHLQIALRGAGLKDLIREEDESNLKQSWL